MIVFGVFSVGGVCSFEWQKHPHFCLFALASVKFALSDELPDG